MKKKRQEDCELVQIHNQGTQAHSFEADTAAELYPAQQAENILCETM